MRDADLWSPATVHGVRDLSPTVREIVLVPDSGLAPWTPGCHLRVQVAVEGRPAVRHYSVVGVGVGAGVGAGEEPAGAQPAAWRIAVKQVRPGRGGSRFMAGLKAGDRLPVSGPHDTFGFSHTPAQTLLLAGGIGITPLVGMALALAARGADLRMAYAARSEAELVYAPLLRQRLGGRLQTFDSSRGQRLALEAEIEGLHPQGQMLACGPVPMLQAAQAAWARAARPPSLLRFETFGAQAAGSEAFHVSLPRHGLAFDVPPHQTLLEALEARGVPALSGCRRGECGVCALDVLQVQGRLDHRDVFLGAEQKQAQRRLCVCVSRVQGSVVLDTAWRAQP